MTKVPSAWPAVDKDMIRERGKCGQTVPATTLYFLGMFTGMFFPKAWNLEMIVRVTNTYPHSQYFTGANPSDDMEIY